MIPLLRKLALIVADAGYVGYEVTRALMDANVWFLIRMSCNATLFTEDDQELKTWTEGIVLAAKPIQCSPCRVLLLIRAEFACEEFRSDYSVRLSKARRDTRHRISAKEKREGFPGRRPHKPPEPPLSCRCQTTLNPESTSTSKPPK